MEIFCPLSTASATKCGAVWFISVDSVGDDIENGTKKRKEKKRKKEKKCEQKNSSNYFFNSLLFGKLTK